MPEAVRNIGASVRARLLRISTENGQNFDLVLTHYAIERLLYCLAHRTATLAGLCHEVSRSRQYVSSGAIPGRVLGTPP